jgi:DNA-directed RNA polymerase subunit RPC12/RpoP
MGTTSIIECSQCGRLFIVAEEQKTRTCPYCGARVDTRKAKKVATAKTAFEASELLRDLKGKKGFSHE